MNIAHQAAYDSWMTGILFIRMAKIIEDNKVQKSEIKLDLIQTMRNKAYKSPIN